MGQFSGEACAVKPIRTGDGYAPAVQTKKAARVSPPPCRCSSLSVFRDTHVKKQCRESSRKFNEGSSATALMGRWALTDVRHSDWPTLKLEARIHLKNPKTKPKNGPISR